MLLRKAHSRPIYSKDSSFLWAGTSYLWLTAVGKAASFRQPEPNILFGKAKPLSLSLLPICKQAHVPAGQFNLIPKFVCELPAQYKEHQVPRDLYCKIMRHQCFVLG
jgi:hypothetical protein